MHIHVLTIFSNFSYLIGVTSKKREPVSHILIFMLSEELRNFKPYAVPVWVVKYQSLTDKKMTELNEEIKSELEWYQ